MDDGDVAHRRCARGCGRNAGVWGDGGGDGGVYRVPPIRIFTVPLLLFASIESVSELVISKWSVV